MSLSKLSSISSLTEFDRMFPTEQDLLYFLMDSSILVKKRNCGKCGREMKIRIRGESLEWRCRDGKKDCSSKAVKSGSFFEKSNLPMRTSIKLIIAWARKYSGLQIEREIGLSHSTVVDWKNMMRELCQKIESNYPPIGGDGEVVEIDESCLHGRKYGRGCPRTEQLWVFGGVQRDSRRCFLKIVDDRTARTLTKELRRHVDLRSTVISDQWKGYSNLKSIFARHETLNHSKEFQRDADDGLNINTNSIEGLWTRMKSPLKKANGTSDDLLPSYLSETVVREWEGDQFFTKILQQLIID